MSPSTMTFCCARTLLASAATLLLLGGCGGGSSDSTPASTGAGDAAATGQGGGAATGPGGTTGAGTTGGGTAGGTTGGSTGSGGGTGGGTTGGGTGATSPAVTTGTYQFGSDPQSKADAESALNAMGQQGYAFVTEIVLGSDMKTVYVKNTSAPTTYEYRFMPTQNSAADWVTQANQLGAASFAYKGPYVFGSDSGELFVRSAAKTATFSYRTDQRNDSVPLADALNGPAASGYQFLGPMIIGGTNYSVSMRDSTRASAFVYRTVPEATDRPTFEQHLQQQGAAGFRFQGPIANANGSNPVELYVQQPGDTGAASYQLTTPLNTSTARLAELNAQAAKGLFMYGDYMPGTSSAGAASIYQAAGAPPAPLTGIVWP